MLCQQTLLIFMRKYDGWFYFLTLLNFWIKTAFPTKKVYFCISFCADGDRGKLA